ncbi:AAA family ATPase [Streptomyces sp. DG2A-72]|uniref:AAA family ATPase n=1 Tax=Streptomyces sp. DG2A-72 TaxID=3051386 RepID=UPI00265B7ECB|nr:AAA family ATPase [Streptomyces sp. DG2A-72]MDO0938661.1 AAA family ATPase [Streptomyces sp. DG2A-72]
MNHATIDPSVWGAVYAALPASKLGEQGPRDQLIKLCPPPAGGFDAADEEIARNDPQNPTQVRLAELRAACVDTGALDGIPDPVALIDGVLYRDSLAWLYGKPGAAKSLVALDWAGCVANGMPWQVREVSRGPVLYLVAEGASGVRRRVRAWERAFGVAMEGVMFLPMAVQLLNGVDRQAFLALVVDLAPSLVVLDTQARVTVGADENSNGEMSKVVQAADQIRQASGACVLMVHHSGKSGLDLRGASAFEGAATSIIKISKDGQCVDVQCEKQKDAEPFETMFLRFRPVGESVVLEARGRGTNTASETTILETLRDSFGTTSATGPQLLEASEVPKSTFYRCLNALVSRGAVTNLGTRNRPRYAIP